MESSATVYQDADVKICVDYVKFSNIEIQELLESSELILMLGSQCAAMLLRSIKNNFRDVLAGDKVRDNSSSACSMPSKVLTAGCQDADPFCLVIVNGIGS